MGSKSKLRKGKLHDDNVKVEVLRLRNDGVSKRAIGRELGIPESSIRAFLKKSTHKDWWALNEKPLAAGNIKSHHNEIEELTEGRYLFLSAQNNTYVHSKVMDTIENVSDKLGAKIIVGTFSYNTSGFTKDKEGFWYDPRIVPYIQDTPLKVADGLLWCGELNISPTAVNPMSGLQSYTGESSCIFPHAKLQLESVATPKHLPAKKMYTTGCVTQRNYISRKEGQKANFHHTYGCLMVEIDADGTWFVYQLIADSDTGAISWGDKEFTHDGKYKQGVRVEALNYGDIHSEKRDDLCFRKSFIDEDSLLDLLKPKIQFTNDISDFSTRNHHNIDDAFFRFEQQAANTDYVEDDLGEVVRTLNEMYRPWCETVVVESNHDLALQKWVKTANFKNDNIRNAIFLLKCQKKSLEAVRDREDFRIFKWALEELGLEVETTFLKEDQSYRICKEHGGGIECGSHGHLGANGGKPSKLTFARSGAKHNTGHTHAFSIFEGAWCAGITCKTEMGYNKGYSSWSQGHIVTYESGKRCIFEFKNGKFFADKLRGE